MKLKVYASLTDDINNGWIWIPDNIVSERVVVKIKNIDTEKIAFCEALPIDDNYIRQYNDPSSRTTYKLGKVACVTINAWYRKKLGISSTQVEHDFKIDRADHAYGHLRAALHHPQTAVRLATRLAIWSLWLGLVAIVLGIVALIPVLQGLAK